jgi:hypothetical protein
MTLSELERAWVREREAEILEDGDTLAIEAGYRAWTWSVDVEWDAPDHDEIATDLRLALRVGGGEEVTAR